MSLTILGCAEVADKAVLWAQAQARLAKTDPNKKWWTVLDVEQALDMSTSTVYRWAQTAHAKNWITEKPGRKGRSKAALFCWNESKTNPLLEDDLAELDPATPASRAKKRAQRDARLAVGVRHNDFEHHCVGQDGGRR